jgi:DNA primase
MQIKVTAVALVAAAVIAPAVASSFNADDSLVTREIDEQNDFFARDFELEERDYDDNELLERDPLFGFRHIKQWIKNRKSKNAAQNQDSQDGSVESREYEDEELVLREFDEMFERDLEELMERDPLFGFNHLKKWFRGKKNQNQNQNAPSSDPSSYDQRDFEEDLETREFDDEEFEAREYDDELEAREYDEILERYFEDLNERELASEAEFVERDIDGEDELMEREYEDDELVARNIIDWFKNLFHKKKPAAKAPEPAAEDAAETREFEDSIDELD